VAPDDGQRGPHAQDRRHGQYSRRRGQMGQRPAVGDHRQLPPRPPE